MIPKVLVITGPTASGKTRMGVELGIALGGEVVSADSMQVYEYMDVGTAKPTAEEMRGVPHHMLSVASPFVKYSAAEYVTAAGEVVDDILRRGKLPIIVGGTGLYIESLVLGRTFAPREEDDALRAKLMAEYDELGGEAMLEKLREKDPRRAEKLHPNDKKRVVRALEAAHFGVNISDHDDMTKAQPPRYDARYIVLGYEERAELYRRIDDRVDEMMEQGLEAEVRKLFSMGLGREHTAMQAIGYKEMAAYLAGESTLEDAVEKIKLGSRRYAKRQISWCTRYGDALRINWKNTPDVPEALRLSTEFWRGEM